MRGASRERVDFARCGERAVSAHRGEREAFAQWHVAGGERGAEPQRCAKAPGFARLTFRCRASLRTAFALALLASALPSHAQQESLYLRTLAANCAQCHGTDGRAAAGSALPPLAGQSRDQLLAQLQAFKAGTRASTIMQQLARGYSDAQLEQLAGFFAAQRRP